MKFVREWNQGIFVVRLFCCLNSYYSSERCSFVRGEGRKFSQGGSLRTASSNQECVHYSQLSDAAIVRTEFCKPCVCLHPTLPMPAYALGRDQRWKRPPARGRQILIRAGDFLLVAARRTGTLFPTLVVNDFAVLWVCGCIFCLLVRFCLHYHGEILQPMGRRGTRAALCVDERHRLNARMYDRVFFLMPRLLVQKHSSTRKRRLNYIIANGES